jgi:hypothetical protein
MPEIRVSCRRVFMYISNVFMNQFPEKHRMALEQQGISEEELLNQQEKMLNDQLGWRNRNLGKKKGQRRRLIFVRMLALFFGIVALMFGFIILFYANKEDANFNNIIIFTVVELAAIPLLKNGINLFRKMPIDQEINDLTELVVETQEGIAQLNEERLKLARKSSKPPSVNRAIAVLENLIDANALMDKASIMKCPQCGESIRREATLCIFCGHSV